MTRLTERRGQDHRIPAFDLPGFCPAVCPALAGLPLSDQRRHSVDRNPRGTFTLGISNSRAYPRRDRDAPITGSRGGAQTACGQVLSAVDVCFRQSCLHALHAPFRVMPALR